MAPGPLLATVVYAVTGETAAGLAGCSNDQLMGIISAGLRMESGSAWIQLAAVREFAARHPGTRLDDEFAADELADELHVTPLSAKEQMDYACTVTTRLPKTFAALGAGRIHPVHVRIIEDETHILTEEDAAKADRSWPGRHREDVRGAAIGGAQAGPSAGPRRGGSARRPPAARRTCAGSGRPPAMPAWWPGSCRRLRCSRLGSMWSSGRWTCAPRGCQAPWRSCGSRPTSICCKNATAATSPPFPATPTPAARTSPRRKATHPTYPGRPAARSGPGTAPGTGPATGPSLAALVTITIP